MRDIIYMDNAATTPLSDEVLNAMMPYLTGCYGNASSVHPKGQQAKRALENARKVISEIIGAKPSEIYFTAGGSESDNWALTGIAESCAGKGKHIITTKIEHHAVLNTCLYLEKRGYEITLLDADENGLVSLRQLEESIRDDTILISIMTANNEVGTIQPVKEIGKIAKKHNVLFHTDAVQAFCHMPLDVNECNISLLSASAHKINGPKGTGLLYVRNGVKINPLIHGGLQERGRRGGTENVAGIVGFAKAAEMMAENLKEQDERTAALRDYMIDRVKAEIPFAEINGADGINVPRLSGNVNIRFKYVDAESLLMILSERGICCSAGSACDSGSISPSHVLLAMGIPYEEAFGSLRFSLSRQNTKDEVDETVDNLVEIVSELRNQSPEYLEL